MRLFCLFILLLSLPAQAGVVFMYHRFGENEHPSTNIRMDQFEAQLEYLARNDFKVWPLPELVKALNENVGIPDKVVSITIDDAYATVHSRAWPLLKKHGFPFAVFVSTDGVDKGLADFMSWDQLRELHAAGVTLANHTASHGYLVRRQAGESEDEWLQRVSADIVKGQQRLQEEIGAHVNESPRLFAWPYGEYSETLAERVRKMGYVAFGQQSGAIDALSDRRALPRFPVNEHYGDIDDFSLKAGTQAFPVLEVSPFDPVIEGTQAPRMMLRIGETNARLAEMTCYFGSEKIVPENPEASVYVIQASRPLPAGRSRYNCTAPGPDGRYFWFSHLWIRR